MSKFFPPLPLLLSWHTFHSSPLLGSLIAISNGKWGLLTQLPVYKLGSSEDSCTLTAWFPIAGSTGRKRLAGLVEGSEQSCAAPYLIPSLLAQWTVGLILMYLQLGFVITGQLLNLLRSTRYSVEGKASAKIKNLLLGHFAHFPCTKLSLPHESASFRPLPGEQRFSRE